MGVLPGNMVVDDHLLLRAPRPGDRKSWAELSSDAGIRERVQPASFSDVLASWQDRGSGMLVIVDQHTDQVGGLVGLEGPLRNDGPHLLCGVLPSWRGSRDGRESPAFSACRAVLDWCQTS